MFKSIKKLFSVNAEYRLPQLLIEEGSRFMCPGCERVLYKATRDMYTGETPEAKDTKGLYGTPDPVDGEIPQCPHCNRYIDFELFNGYNWY